MDTDSASIDITDIKRILLQAREVENSCPLSRTLTTNCVVFPQYSILGQSDSEQSTVDNETVRAIRAHYDQLSPQRALPSQNTWPTLPSTVPDSQQIHLSTDVESQFRFIHPALPSALNAIITSLAPATMSQVDDALTQELSPSHFDSYIHKSRSARQLEGGVEDDINYIHAQQTDETQFTLHEGDEGHIDLVSSLEQRLEGVNDHDSDPPDKDFSPTQSEPALSQFPESQRFKTPATAGKKRRYNGDAIDTPLLPRNPLRGQAVQDNGNVMGLSQAFAATQADTSPFMQVGQIDLHSDRPSPNIQLQPQPIGADTSSPLRMLPEFQKASTEPASRYISVNQSQAKRKRQVAIQLQRDLAQYDDDSDDSLAHEDSESKRRRRQLEIDQRAQVAVRQASSPSRRRKRANSATKSSALPGPTHSSPIQTKSADTVYTIESSPPNQVTADFDNHIESDNETEVETEQEDNADIVVTRSSQGRVAMDAEDKENLSQTGSQVPETTARLQQAINQLPSHVQESPSMRRSHRYTIHSRTVLDSSEPIAVANSQPSQPQGQRQTLSTTAKPALSQGIEFVPQSPTVSPRRTLEAQSLPTADPFGRGDDATPMPNHDPSLLDTVFGATEASGNVMAGGASLNFHSTIPETSSNEEDIPKAGVSDQIDRRQDTDQTSTNTHFETAVSQFPDSIQHNTPSNKVDLSCPPALTTLTSQKRNRLTEIAAEPSPRKSQSQSQSQPSFNVSQALEVEKELQVGLSPGPSHIFSNELAVHRTNIVLCSSGDSQKENEVSHNVTSERLRSPQSHRDSESPITDTGVFESTAKSAETPAIYSSMNRKRSIQLSSALRESVRTKPRVPPSSKWDIEASPPQRAVPVMKSTVPTPASVQEAEALSKRKQSVQKRVKIKKTYQTPRPLGTNSPIAAINPSSDPTSMGDLDQAQAVSSPTTDRLLAPNMVFACFNGKSRAYYPTLCHGLSAGENKRFLIQWEGCDVDEVDEYGVRSLDLRVGDFVKVALEGFPKVSYVIRGFKDKISQEMLEADVSTVTDVRGYKTLVVAPKQRKSLPAVTSIESVKEVPCSAIYLDSNMWGQMKDRPFEYNLTTHDRAFPRFITPGKQASFTSTPTSRSRRAKPTGNAIVGPSLLPSSSPSGLFANMAFVITYTQSLKDWESRTDALATTVESNDGDILEDSFEDLLEHSGLDLKARYANYKFAALLTNHHSRKPKYMQALALGIPCLSDKWVDACVKADKLVDWTFYLLAAGESSELDGAIKSRILPYMANALSTTVSGMVDMRLDIFAGARVVIFTGKGKVADMLKPFDFLMHALGAETVEAVSKLDAANDLLQSIETNNDGKGVLRILLVDDTQIAEARRTISSDPRSKPKNKGRARSINASSTPTVEEGEEGGGGGPIKIVGKEAIMQSLILGRLVVL